MSLLGILILLVVAAIAGAIGQAIAGYSHGGFLVSIVVGLIGAVLGWWLAGVLRLPELLMINIDGQPFHWCGRSSARPSLPCWQV